MNKTESKVIEWKDLMYHEQSTFLKYGYKPSVGTIIHYNLDIEYEKVTQPEKKPWNMSI